MMRDSKGCEGVECVKRVESLNEYWSVKDSMRIVRRRRRECEVGI